MTQKEFKKRSDEMRSAAAKAAESKESARKFLIKAGLFTKSGQLAKPYR